MYRMFGIIRALSWIALVILHATKSNTVEGKLDEENSSDDYSHENSSCIPNFVLS